MQLLILVYFLSLIEGIVGKSCIPNDVVDELKISFPEDGKLVEKHFTLAAGLFCFDTDKCKGLVKDWYVCLNVTGYDELQCNNPIFDELPVELVSNQEYQSLSISLCNDEFGCICSSSITVQCCIEETNKVSLKEAEQLEKLEYMKYQLRNELTSEITLQTKQVPVCWVNHPWSTSLKSLYIGIKSSAFNYVKREAIRNSWLRTLRSEPNLSLRVCVYFILGEVIPSTKYPGLVDMLAEEQSHFHDLLFGDVIPVPDSYYTLTNKTLAFLRFIQGLQHPDSTDRGGVRDSNSGGKDSEGMCNSDTAEAETGRRFAMVVDDDVYIDILRWAVVLLESDTYPARLFYGGRVCTQLQIVLHLVTVSYIGV